MTLTYCFVFVCFLACFVLLVVPCLTLWQSFQGVRPGGNFSIEQNVCISQHHFSESKDRKTNTCSAQIWKLLKSVRSTLSQQITLGLFVFLKVWAYLSTLSVFTHTCACVCVCLLLEFFEVRLLDFQSLHSGLLCLYVKSVHLTFAPSYHKTC